MRAHDAWRTFTILFVLSLATVSAFMVNQGEDLTVVLSIAVVAVAVYLYIAYKRYHVERITENDLRLFDDPEDLRILCKIYGLPHKGSPNRLRHHLAQFSRDNSDSSFVWVAPLFIKALVSNLEFAPGMEGEEELPENSSELLVRMITPSASRTTIGRPLLWGQHRSSSRRRTITSCPICDVPVGQKVPMCSACGADLEFYDALLDSKIGRRLIAQKSDSRDRNV